jgi:hypothetical protein
MMEAIHGPEDKADARIFIWTPGAIQVTQNTVTGRTYCTETFTDAKGASRRVFPIKDARRCARMPAARKAGTRGESSLLRFARPQ